MNKIRIGGLKLSSELVLIKQSFPIGADSSILLIYRVLAQHRINIQYASAVHGKNRIQFFCLVSAEESGRIRRLLRFDSSDESNIEIVSGKGMLTLFPHRGRLDILGQVLNAFKNAGIIVYAYSSSISTLVFVIDYNKQENAVMAAGEHFALPHYHSPFKSKIVFVEKRN